MRDGTTGARRRAHPRADHGRARRQSCRSHRARNSSRSARAGKSCARSTSDRRASRPPTTVQGVHHLALICRDTEETIKFYQEFLGFPLVELVENRDYKGSNHFFFDIGNNNLLGFFDFPGHEHPAWMETIGGVQHLAISVSPDAVRRGQEEARRGRRGLSRPGPGCRGEHVLPRPQWRRAWSCTARNSASSTASCCSTRPDRGRPAGWMPRRSAGLVGASAGLVGRAGAIGARA